ncbi:MAG: sodium:proton antiporter [Candidatus Gracilibacteria bacterium]|nr:sodium:proton antiporter [Candidatus Gracilibacteria bacterium]
MDISFLSSTLSVFFLLTISVLIYLFTKKINFPYTVALLLVGIGLIPLSNTDFFGFINHFQLTPEVLFYVFLPILLFESAYNISYRQMMKNYKAIVGMAVFGLLISTFIIAILLYFILPFIGFEIPFLVCLLFGGLISSTDPVAVLSIFKSIGAPRRLTLLFEGESLFNDGTSLAIFLVVLGIILEGGKVTSNSIFGGIGIFLSMAIGGIIFGSILGIIFSKIIGKIKNSELGEITLTMILAHLTFISSEVITEHLVLFGHQIHISGVISTTIAGLIVGNYGRYKISPKVELHMNQFWEFFAFISNSLVFILMGLILSHIDINWLDFTFPILVTILIVIISRFISVYIPIGIINKFKLEENIPTSWTFLLSWGSLRGALALMMALMIPEKGTSDYQKVLDFQNYVGWNFDFDIRDFILVITISCIIFTLFIKATTIPYLMNKFGITKLHDLEEF